MQNIFKLCSIILLCGSPVFAQGSSQSSSATKTQGPAGPDAQSAASSYSGMYTFVQDGEFVQLTVEDQADNNRQNQKNVTGFVSRYGNAESDRGAFLDQFIKQGTLDGNLLTFSTDTVHGTWYEFKGTVDRGSGKNLGDEGYYTVKGTLSEYLTDGNKKVSTKSRQVAFRSFPQDAAALPAKTD